MSTSFRIVFGFLLPAVLSFGGIGCAGNGGNDRNANSLSGKVTFQGQPVAFASLVAIGPDKTKVSSPTDADGNYAIINPPKGPLKFEFTDIPAPAPPRPNPPPPAGVKYNIPPPAKEVSAPPPPPVPTLIPAKYRKEGNELSFEYTGGRQTYNIDLKP